MWPHVPELFDAAWIEPALIADGVAVDVAELRPEWDAYISQVLTEATLAVPTSSWTARGGRDGLHTEAMGYLLAEMQHIHRSHPGASW
jgi:ring-1,2-phenylacetyl-CoA epoxidase subunit PaaC